MTFEVGSPTNAKRKRALVVNASAEIVANNRYRVFYNLGAEKLVRYLSCEGYHVSAVAGDPGLFSFGYDLVAVSAIFSWHAPTAADVAVRAKASGAEVWAGGPGMYGTREWFRSTTGIVPVWRPDSRFETVVGDFRYGYAVRGCAGEMITHRESAPCSWCVVPKIEGSRYRLNRDFRPTPMLLDNNLSGMPVEFQEFIIARYLETGVPLVDANSGFEPGLFDRATRQRWQRVLRGPWRWGFDRMAEERNAFRMAAELEDLSPRRKMVYVLAGNEPLSMCYERAQKVFEMGAEPHVQFHTPLGALSRYDVDAWPLEQRPKFDWNIQLGRDFARYYTGHFWRAIPIWDYDPRPGQPKPFAHLRRRQSVISIPTLSSTAVA